jgi:NIMA (never in mitosis gene a)-related kinase
MEKSLQNNFKDENSKFKCFGKKKDYEKYEEIGVSVFSRIFIGKQKVNEKIVCLQYISLCICNEERRIKDIEKNEKEAQELEKLNHPNIVHYFDHFVHKNDFIIVQEFLEGISLKELIEEAVERKEKFEEDFICQILSVVVSALSYCHTFDITHRDIRPDNILITNENSMKLINFGISRIVKIGLERMMIPCETIVYMSPEMVIKQSYKLSSDIWSLGIVIYELMALKHPFSYNSIQYLNMIIDKAVPQLNNLQYSPDLISIVEMMLSLDPSNRISCKQLHDHPFLAKYLSMQL